MVCGLVALDLLLEVDLVLHVLDGVQGKAPPPLVAGSQSRPGAGASSALSLFVSRCSSVSAQEDGETNHGLID